MKFNGGDRVRRIVQRIQRRVAPKGLILMYHRVTEVPLDPWNLCVTPARFAEHLEVLQNYTIPTRLQQLVEAHQRECSPHRTVAITFDDGYIDNLYQAKPLLENYAVPATVFVSTGYLGQNREFWWDELEHLLLQSDSLPEELCLTLNGQMYQWKLGEATQRNEAYNQYDYATQTWADQTGTRLALYYSIWQHLQPLAEAERLNAIDEIRAWVKAEATIRSTHRPLVPEEIVLLAADGLVDIGAHTVTHPFLSAHPTHVQRDEIRQSKADLEGLLARPVVSFAYPFGDYTSETARLVQDAGFVCACSTAAGTVWQQSDRFQLPRVEVQNWTGEEFAQRLLRWLND